ncbi:hypothetical protein [Flavobacterium sp. 102]|uniref:hypothetical protein n=1 Tax=Flavobacterium sp. 102 TaxID=2135623 RepID=UPI000F21B116|nr:hypothetical protein [Flavobacterium sp. 102]RKS00569.1 hypothetical protein C8C84_0188 [Flavobacterium sp. 102]
MMKKLLKSIRVILIIALLSLNSCREKEQQPPQNFVPANAEDLTEEELKKVHTDTNYKYEYRTGTSGDYGYSYNVSGYDDNGNEVTGNVSMEDKYGTGTITNSDGEEVDINVEWIGYGELKATDQDGNEYELAVD